MLPFHVKTVLSKFQWNQGEMSAEYKVCKIPCMQRRRTEETNFNASPSLKPSSREAFLVIISVHVLLKKVHALQSKVNVDVASVP
jgi:hypothetical protein